MSAIVTRLERLESYQPEGEDARPYHVVFDENGFITHVLPPAAAASWLGRPLEELPENCTRLRKDLWDCL